jgi:hypothetical protein
MPVIGHTLVGIVVAQQFSPDASTRAHESVWGARTFRLPTIVGLSYLPDVLTQLGIWLELPSAQAAGHSVPVACVLGAMLGALWSRLAGTSRRRTIALAAGVIVLHDALDLFQDVERMPLWPLSMRQVGLDWLMFTDRLTGEVVAFGLPFAAYQVWRIATRRPLLGADPAPAAARWTTGLFIGCVLATTVGVIHLRETRETQMGRAEDLLRAGRLTEALASIDAAERWPSSAGQGDLLRGRIYVRMGADTRAEEVFLRAYRNDPEAFWTAAALAEFYAARGSAETRRARSAPYVETLRERFGGHDGFLRVMERIERSLKDGE